jgi:soluble lytic murein transglycosylase-like protein
MAPRTFAEYVEHDPLFARAELRWGVDAKLLKRQVWAESSGRHNAVSPRGAKGLAQFMPATWAEWAPAGADPFDPAASIDTQARYMRWLMKQAGGARAALAAYNWGIGRVLRARARLGDAWETALPAETRGYLRKILG